MLPKLSIFDKVKGRGMDGAMDEQAYHYGVIGRAIAEIDDLVFPVAGAKK